MTTVKDYFSAPDTSSIFADVLSDVKDYANNSNLTADDVKDLIIEKYASMHINGNPTVTGFRNAVKIWHLSRKYYFDGLLNTTTFNYNPIHNVSEHTTELIDYMPRVSETRTTEDTTELTHGHSITNSDSVTGTGQVTTFDDSINFDNDSKTIQTGTSTTSNAGKDTTDVNRTETTNKTGTDKTTTEKDRSGNIGVTSTQELIRQEREILNFDILQIWLERFAERFFIPIYKFERSF